MSLDELKKFTLCVATIKNSTRDIVSGVFGLCMTALKYCCFGRNIHTSDGPFFFLELGVC